MFHPRERVPHTRRSGKLYRYYVSTDVLKRDGASCPIRRVRAAEIENAVEQQRHRQDPHRSGLGACSLRGCRASFVLIPLSAPRLSLNQ